MSEPQQGIDVELEAIKTVTKVLQPLDTDAQKRVLEYAMHHLKAS